MAMIPITFAGATNFKSNLYALEVRSRFIDQNHANGYYKGYGEELKASVSGNVITVGSGAFLVQGRALEIDAGGETVSVDTTQSGNVGYLLARIETRPGEDGANCTLTVKTAGSLDAIKLTKEDTYERDSETENRVCELPLYSFKIENGAIMGLKLEIAAIEENTQTRKIAESAQKAAEESAVAAKAAQEAAQNAEAVLYMHNIHMHKELGTNITDIWTVISSKEGKPVESISEMKKLVEGVGFALCSGISYENDKLKDNIYFVIYIDENGKMTIPIYQNDLIGTSNKTYLMFDGDGNYYEELYYHISDTVI